MKTSNNGCFRKPSVFNRIFLILSFIFRRTAYHSSRTCKGARHASTTVLLLLLSLTLAADDFFQVKDKTIDESVLKFGLLYMTPLFLLENVGYSSNIFTYEEKERPDWTGDLGVGLRASMVIANRLILQGEDLPQYSFYLENKNLRSWSNHFSAAAYSYLGPVNIKAGYEQNNLHQRPQLEFSRPFRFTKSEWSGEADIGRRYNLFLTAYFAFKKLEYDEAPYLGDYNLAESLNHRESVFGLKLNRRVFTRTIIYLNLEMNEYVFVSRSERDSHAQTMALGIEFPEIGGLRGSIQVGIRRLDPKNPYFRQSQSINGSGNVNLTLFERLRFNLFYTLGTNFSYSADELFYNNQSFGGGAEIYLTRFLKGGASYSEGRLRYKSFLDLASQRSDRLRNQRYYLAVPFFGNTSLGLAYNVYRLSSDALGLDYTRSFWGGFISYEF
jgi:hypothetical protein